MPRVISNAGTRIQVLANRALERMGFSTSGFLLIMAVLIGMITAAAAVAFHELINLIRNQLYGHVGEHALYGKWMILLVVWPAVGGLLVGIISHVIVRSREGHGIIDVMESVIRSSGFIRPGSALEKILTSAITIGTGGAAGAEGPIVQIGAAISGGIGSVFGISRESMPVLVGCGCAAGISAIFNSPIGGLLFTIEVILQDFSIRTIVPLVLASVIANVTTGAIYHHMLQKESYDAIFHVASTVWSVTWPQLGNFLALGVACGLVGAALTVLLDRMEALFKMLNVPRWALPGIGGGLLGCTGIVYVMIFGHLLLGVTKPVPYSVYPMPAYFGDGYPAIEMVLAGNFYHQLPLGPLTALLAGWLILKLFGTCLTISSGGSGGIIAPALFLGACVGGFTGSLIHAVHLFSGVQPEVYALVGMAAVLAAVVHAPLASILILAEVTKNNSLVLPAMFATVVATATARRIVTDSVYTRGLRSRGIQLGTGTDMMLLRRLTVEQVDLDPAPVLQPNDPFQRVLDLSVSLGTTDFVVIDADGTYLGMIVNDDVNATLLRKDAVPLLLVSELMRSSIPTVRSTDDLATVMDVFTIHNVSRLPVCLPNSPGKVIGLISRVALMRRYRRGLAA